VYLDNAATTQKPRQVIQALTEFYETSNANIHRGIHTLAEEATAAFEGVRGKVAAFIHAADEQEIIFTRNTTESINLVANAWGRRNLKPGDTIVLTEMEHHSNIVPWQIVAQATGARIRAIPLLPDGTLDLQAAHELISGSGVKMVAVTQMSNVLGTINPVADLAAMAHAAGALITIDGAQSTPHLPVDMEALDADFFAFSAHKMLGPTGVGVLYGKQAHLASMDPYQGGGSMIARVRIESSTYAEGPARFEAGTPNIADVIAFSAALDYLSAIRMECVRAHEVDLMNYTIDRLRQIPDLRIFGPLETVQRGGVVAFDFGGLHPHDISQMLDSRGVAVRAGHHCAQPLHASLNIEVGSSTRASFYIYNDRDDVDALIEALQFTGRYFGLPAQVAS
jgi:cysteine desulfurase/selenocysteine lyase